MFDPRTSNSITLNSNQLLHPTPLIYMTALFSLMQNLHFLSFTTLMYSTKAVKTGGPVRLGSSLTGFEFYRVGPENPIRKWA